MICSSSCIIPGAVIILSHSSIVRFGTQLVVESAMFTPEKRGGVSKGAFVLLARTFKASSGCIYKCAGCSGNAMVMSNGHVRWWAGSVMWEVLQRLGKLNLPVPDVALRATIPC